MQKVTFNVGGEFCLECAMAVNKFLRNLEGVDTVEKEGNVVAITFDESQISPESLSKIARENIERLGYKIKE